MNNIIDLSGVEIPKVYGTNGRMSIYDYIAYIRKQFVNPWETCYFIEEECSFDNNMLEAYNLECISSEDRDRLEVEEQHRKNMIDQVYFVITKEQLDYCEKDFGLKRLIQDFMQKYSISNVNILLYFTKMDADERILRAIDELQDKYSNGYLQDNQMLILPAFTYVGKVSDNTAIDISDFVNEIVYARERETLTLSKIREFDDFIKNRINENKQIRSIAYFGAGSNIVLRALVSYLCLKYDLSYGISLDSQYNWISECGFTYMYGRMSMYERYHFVCRLPVAMKYRPNKILEADCRKIGFVPPEVIAAYNFDTTARISKEYDLSQLSLEDTIDFCSLFVEQSPIGSTTLQPSKFTKYPDYQTDMDLTDKFIAMDPGLNINIRNSLLYYDKELDARVLLVTSGDFLLQAVVAAKGVFTKEQIMIKEENFNKLSRHPELYNTAGDIPLVMDLEAILILLIFSYKPLYLSYYELALRWVSNMEDNVYNNETVDLFSYIPLEEIRKEANSRYFISSFGKPLSFDKNTQKNIVLRITNKFMAGKELPK